MHLLVKKEPHTCMVNGRDSLQRICIHVTLMVENSDSGNHTTFEYCFLENIEKSIQSFQYCFLQDIGKITQVLNEYRWFFCLHDY
jgi:hypothetical protein